MRASMFVLFFRTTALPVAIAASSAGLSNNLKSRLTHQITLCCLCDTEDDALISLSRASVSIDVRCADAISPPTPPFHPFSSPLTPLKTLARDPYHSSCSCASSSSTDDVYSIFSIAFSFFLLLLNTNDERDYKNEGSV